MAKTPELTAEDIMSNDVDPIEAIRELRRNEGIAEDELPVNDEPIEPALDDKSTNDENQEQDDGITPTLTDAEKEAEAAAEKERLEAESDEDKAAAEAAATADAAIEAADKAADEAEATKGKTKEEIATAKKDANEKAVKKAVEDYEKLSDEEKIVHDKKVETEAAAKAEAEKPAGRTFKANNQEFTFTEEEILDQFETVFGQAMNYTQKMQKIAPYRKMISALEQEGVTHDSLNIALDALKGDKGAIKKLMEMAKIDSYDLAKDDEDDAPYVPGNYGKNETVLDIEEITSMIQGDEEFKITTNVIDEQWDNESRKRIAENPNMIVGLHNDIKSGLYDKVAPAAMKMKVLDGNTKSDIEYYILAGEQLRLKMEAELKEKEGQEKVKNLNADAQNADSKFDKASSEAVKKRAASSTGKRADRKGVIDYLDDDDEAYDAWYKNLNASI